MKLTHASIVYMSLGQLRLRPPRRVAYHRQAQWPTRVDGLEHGVERHWTACGLLIYEYGERMEQHLDGLRIDNARLVGRPCWRCWA